MILARILEVVSSPEQVDQLRELIASDLQCIEDGGWPRHVVTCSGARHAVHLPHWFTPKLEARAVGKLRARVEIDDRSDGFINAWVLIEDEQPEPTGEGTS